MGWQTKNDKEAMAIVALSSLACRPTLRRIWEVTLNHVNTIRAVIGVDIC